MHLTSEKQCAAGARSERLRTVHRLHWWPAVGLLAGVLTFGCASVPSSELDLRKVAIVLQADDPMPALAPNEASSGAKSDATEGAAVGLGTGLGLAGLCVLAGPVAMPCVAVVVPGSMAAGAAGGAAASAMRADPAQASRSAVGSELAKMSHAGILAERMQRKARELFQVEMPLLADPAAADPANAAAPQWLISVALTDVSLTKLGVFDYLIYPVLRLRVAGRITLRRASESQVTYQHVLVVSDTGKALTMAEWEADSRAMMRVRLDQQLDVLAERMLLELKQSAAMTLPRRAIP
jgi:hypothetical protein